MVIRVINVVRLTWLIFVHRDSETRVLEADRGGGRFFGLEKAGICLRF
jgi:hypothetical protein